MRNVLEEVFVAFGESFRSAMSPRIAFSMVRSQLVPDPGARLRHSCFRYCPSTELKSVERFRRIG